VKVVKNKAYFKRYQVKFRRRREGKTDYLARRFLITQDKNKYNSPKYRLVVRLTNTGVICQVVYAKIEGDYVMTAAYSNELPKYGVKSGLNNYPAAYCVGLLCARRLLTKLNMDKEYVGQTEPDGEMFMVEEGENSRPFCAYLDIGLTRATCGNKVFGVMKGAVDGGLEIPHNEKRFPGYADKELDVETFRARIFGEHIADYMETLAEEEPDEYKAKFSGYIKAGITSDNLVDMYKNAHTAIRANPAHVKKATKEGMVHKRYNKKKSTYKERKNKIKQKLEAFERSKAAQE